jgi:hypothetical protein
MAQVVEPLPTKHKALSSILILKKKKKGNEDRRPLTTPVIEMEVQESNSDVNTRVIKRSRG